MVLPWFLREQPWGQPCRMQCTSKSDRQVQGTLLYVAHSSLHAIFLYEGCKFECTLDCPAMTQGASLTLGLTISRSPKENRWSSGPHCLHNSRKIDTIVRNVSAL